MSMEPDQDIYNGPTQPRPLRLPALPATVGQPTLPLQQENQAGGTFSGPAASPASNQSTTTKRPMSRRKLIGGLGALGLAGAAGGIALEQLWAHGVLHGPMADSAQTGHLLRRAGFGATPDELTMYRGLGFSGAVDRLLNYQQVSDDDLEQRLGKLNLDLNKPVDQQRWWLLRMAGTKRPLLEKMTLFWHGVLTSSFRKVGGPTTYQRMIIQNQFLRNHAFDTFDNILLGITSDPAMLVYLDLTKSTSRAPNENYARELMELFTLGLGHYTQQDVSEGAAALTGWHVRGLESYYAPRSHNTLTKRYLGQTGNLDYKDVIHILANNPATPWFICRKLFSFFVYENPSIDDLKPLVDSYVQSGHNMGAVMRTLLLSPQFSSTKAYRGRVKSPVEFAVGAYRTLNIQNDGTGWSPLVTLLGQTIFDPPNVAGWPGDKVSALWLNSGTWMTRLNYLDLLLVRGTFHGKGGKPIDLQAVVNANQIDSPERFVDYFASFLLDGVLDSGHRSQLLAYFTTSDSSKRGGQITLTGGKSYPLNRARGTLYLLMASPEYQLN
ncbi:MAG: DUF1800 domain-containing protein [Chloroflexota bacterium]|nr:DUF1800 domain-containing protein [Chloroflexota bacterium]